MEITDEMIKAKHKEFNARVFAAIHGAGNQGNNGRFNLSRLRQLVQSGLKTVPKR